MKLNLENSVSQVYINVKCMNKLNNLKFVYNIILSLHIFKVYVICKTPTLTKTKLFIN